MQAKSVLATMTGRDRPGVTAALLAALAAHDVDVRDIEQVVVRDRLILAVLVDIHGDPAALRSSVAQAAAALGMDCDVSVVDTDDPDGFPRRPGGTGGRSHVIVIGLCARARSAT